MWRLGSDSSSSRIFSRYCCLSHCARGDHTAGPRDVFNRRNWMPSAVPVPAPTSLHGCSRTTILRSTTAAATPLAPLPPAGFESPIRICLHPALALLPRFLAPDDVRRSTAPRRPALSSTAPDSPASACTHQLARLGKPAPWVARGTPAASPVQSLLHRRTRPCLLLPVAYFFTASHGRGSVTASVATGCCFF